MTDETMMVYRAGTFTMEASPPWMCDIRAAAETLGDWDKAAYQVLGERVSHIVVGDGGWDEADFSARRTPGGGYHVEMMAGDSLHAEVWLPDPADWLPFNAVYVEPFLLARATIRQNDRIDRLANAVIAFARHGDGRHIDRLTGESRIDQREDWERRKRERATCQPLAAR